MLFSPSSSKLVVEEFTIHVTRKPIRSLRLSIRPSSGEIRLSAPLYTFDRTIQTFVVSRLDWIRKHVSQIVPRSENPLQCETGEIHAFEGREYVLECRSILSRSGNVCLEGENIVLTHPQSTTKEYKQKLLALWYKQELEKRIAPLIEHWEWLMNVRVSSYATRQMKTRWGTCNTRSNKILLNLELMKKSPDCLEYVVVHEMVHLLEASHNARFHALMTKYLPDWKTTKRKLNGFATEKDC